MQSSILTLSEEV
jgi:hypothetical protein